jgi:hypothetical protein
MNPNSKPNPPLFTPQQTYHLADSGQVEVHELAWPDALAFFNKLREQAGQLADGEGNIKLDAAKLLTAVADNAELAGWLVQKTCRREADWLNERSLGEVLDLVTLALEINLGVIRDRIKNVKGRLAELAAGAIPTKSSPTSPASATP